ncbi:1,2-phenylacetyl-CoA epoxidase subunit PaaE [Actinophytocola gossypii]|uniref:Phenylacetate-CoA oxygenase/reductase subunit PaaK n=1 Tax=Actinophytocola gossypii TaxID=2812003 RepID=A0ABT2JCN4_9PSEU|nr:1,2-phenylacetyl-CoA epoxidase subunit PaaE [Actinophytocola gossypii]MCT2585628.1 phenylacetate-CoA oxygenase/reductase subunit PaaK [Actinophytocola gossypii]
MPTFHQLPVARVDRLCADAVAVTFAVPPELASEFAFRAGQYLTLRQEVDGVEERRSYSICASPSAAPRIGVRRVEDGLFSTRLVDRLRPGDLLDVMPPQGRFTPDPADHGGHHAFVAAGSGITPVLSIMTALLESDEDTRVTLLYGNRRTDTVMFGDELADLKDRHPARLQLVHVLSREPRDVALFSGRLDEERLTTLLGTVIPTSDVDHWWLCGPYGMLTDAGRALDAHGVPPNRVHRELFYVDEPPPEVRRVEETGVDGPAADVTIVLDGRETTLTLPADTPILDAAQRVRADLPFACKGGVCGTCRAKLTEGEVEMRRNYALEQHELDEGFVLTCQALPRSPTIAVDYDA